MAIPFHFRNSAKGFIEGGFDHPLLDNRPRAIAVHRSDKYPLIWTVMGVTALCGTFWFAVIDLAARLLQGQ